VQTCNWLDWITPRARAANRGGRVAALNGVLKEYAKRGESFLVAAHLDVPIATVGMAEDISYLVNRNARELGTA